MSTNPRQIIQRYFSGSYPRKVIKKFTIWLKESSGSVEKESILKEIWDDINIQADETTEKSFETLQTTIQSTVPPVQKLPFIYKLSRIAAVLLLPIISIGITYYIMSKSVPVDNEIKLVECIVPDGEIRTITLPDSSIVTINSGSILIYPQQFISCRDVFLNGEAYFSVTRDEAKPFVVKTTDMDVEVLGTIFNISSYSDSENSATTLEKGKVSIRFKNTGRESMILLPEEQLIYNRNSGSIEKNTINIENTIAWTEGNLIIQSMSIDDVIKVIKRKYGMKVYLNSSNYKDEKITMKAIHGENITEFMAVLELLVPQLKYKIEDDKLYIY